MTWACARGETLARSESVACNFAVILAMRTAFQTSTALDRRERALALFIISS